MKKLSILAAFALSAALILSGCNPNAEDETAGGTGTTTETTTGTESNTPADEATGDAATSTETGSGTEAKTYVSSVPEDATAIFDAFGLTALPSNFSAPGWGYTASIEDDSTYGKTLNLKLTGDAGNYPTCEFTFDAVDLTGKTIYFVIKGKTDITNSDDDMKVLLISDETHKSEHNGFRPDDDSKYTIKQTAVNDYWTAWSADNSILAVDTTSISKLHFALQKADYDFQIASIYYK